MKLLLINLLCVLLVCTLAFFLYMGQSFADKSKFVCIAQPMGEVSAFDKRLMISSVQDAVFNILVTRNGTIISPYDVTIVDPAKIPSGVYDKCTTAVQFLPAPKEISDRTITGNVLPTKKGVTAFIFYDRTGIGTKPWYDTINKTLSLALKLDNGTSVKEIKDHAKMKKSNPQDMNKETKKGIDEYQKMKSKDMRELQRKLQSKNLK